MCDRQDPDSCLKGLMREPEQLYCLMWTSSLTIMESAEDDSRRV